MNDCFCKTEKKKKPFSFYMSAEFKNTEAVQRVMQGVRASFFYNHLFLSFFAITL